MQENSSLKIIEDGFIIAMDYIIAVESYHLCKNHKAIYQTTTTKMFIMMYQCIEFFRVSALFWDCMFIILNRLQIRLQKFMGFFMYFYSSFVIFMMSILSYLALLYLTHVSFSMFTNGINMKKLKYFGMYFFILFSLILFLPLVKIFAGNDEPVPNIIDLHFLLSLFNKHF